MEITLKLRFDFVRHCDVFLLHHNYVICLLDGLLLKPGPGPWTRTLKNLDPEKHGKQLDMEK